MFRIAATVALCLGAILFNILIAALPIAVVVTVVLWLLRVFGVIS